MSTKDSMEERLKKEIGGLILHCGNVYNEQGTEISQEVGQYILSEKEMSYREGRESLIEEVVKLKSNQIGQMIQDTEGAFSPSREEVAEETGWNDAIKRVLSIINNK